MKKLQISSVLLLSLFILSLTACSKRVENPNWVINEVLVKNVDNYVDEYGQRSGWIEIYNNSAKTQDIGGHFLTDDKSNPKKYPIPRGDVLTKIPPHQHVLFWASNKPYQGTFHVNFELDRNNDNYIALYDESGTKLIDEVVVPRGQQEDVSWGYKIDGVKYDKENGSLLFTKLSKVTPSTNNYTLDKNVKVERFKQQDRFGLTITITAMLVVFSTLLTLYIVFKLVGQISSKLKAGRRAKSVSGTSSFTLSPEQDIPGEVLSAIFMALHEEQSNVHDFEHTILTINKINRPYSPWSSKIYGLRELPHK